MEAIKRIILALVLVWAVAARAAPYTIPGFRPWVNVDGINVSYTYNPINADGSFKPEWLSRLQGLNPGGIRFMDWSQTVGSPIVNWSDRSTSDTSVKGVRYETEINLANTLRAGAWVNSPTMATEDFDGQLGTLWGASYRGPVLKYEKGNELWNGGDGYQGTWNLLQARAEGYPGPSDTEKMAQRAAWREYKGFLAFAQKAREAGYTGRIEWEIGGFIANSYWTTWKMEYLKARGVNPAALGGRLAIAAYAPGSPTDVNVTTADSHAQAIAKIQAFVNQYILPWIGQNKATADYYGLAGIDQYENAFGSNYTIGNAALTAYWKDLQFDPLMEGAERDFIKAVYAAQGSQGVYDVFGLVGPWGLDAQYGQWALLPDVNTMTPKYLGVQDVIDYSTVPEPSADALLLCGLAMLLAHRRGRRA